MGEVVACVASASRATCHLVGPDRPWIRDVASFRLGHVKEAARFTSEAPRQEVLKSAPLNSHISSGRGQQCCLFGLAGTEYNSACVHCSVTVIC